MFRESLIILSNIFCCPFITTSVQCEVEVNMFSGLFQRRQEVLKSNLTSIKLASVNAEYKKNKELKRSDIQLLMKWLEMMPHLPKLSEIEVIIFHYAAYYKIDNTKTMIEHYYEFRSTTPEFFENRTMENAKLEKAIETIIIMFMPGQTPNGSWLLYIKVIDSKLKHFNYPEYIKILDMIVSVTLLKYGTCSGLIILIDTECISFSHFLKISPSMLKKSINFFKDVFNTRRGGMFIVNPLKVIDRMMNCIKPFLNDEIMEDIHIVKNNKELFKHIPKKMVPKYLGGSGMDRKELHELMKQTLRENQPYYQEDEIKRRIDPSTRPVKKRWSLFQKW